MVDYLTGVLFLRIEPTDNHDYTVSLEVKPGMAEYTGRKRLKQAETVSLSDGLRRRLHHFADCRRRQGGIRKLDAKSSLPDQMKLEREIGVEIYRTFFAGEMGRVFGEFFGLLTSRKIEELVLVVSSPQPDILNIPFDMMRAGAEDLPFCLQHDRLLLAHTVEARLRDFDLQGITPLAPPLRLLFVSALPVDLDEEERLLELEGEQELLIDALGDLVSEQKVVVEFLDIASLEEIDRALAKGAHHIVHVSGHGAHLDVSDQPVGVLFLEDEAGSTVAVSGKELAQRLNKHGSVKLVVLSACETARAEEFGTAGALIKAGLPAVLAMHYPVSDSAATLFTSAFYESLCRGDSLGRCLFHARQRVYAHEQEVLKEALDQGETAPQPSEWMTPFLYLNQHIRGLIDYSRKTSDTHYFFQKPVSLVVGGKYVGRGFVGRHKEIIRLNQWFRQGQRSVCIYGQGGTGKTTLAIRFADNFDSGAYKIVQWVGEVTEEQILDRLAKEAQSSLGPEIVDLVHSPDFSVQHKLDLLIAQHLSRHKLILLFDNFEENQMESKAQGIYQPEIHSPTLKEFLTHLCRGLKPPSFILFTTRYRFSQPGVQGLNLGEMRFSDTFKLINRFRHLVQLTLEKKRRVHQKLGGHPRALELLEELLKEEETTWPEVSSRLKEAVETEINHDLLLERLTAEEQQILHGAAVFRHLTPLPGLTAVTDLDEPTIRRALDRLNALSLCFLEDDKCYIHRLTAHHILAKLPSKSKKHSHLRAALYFYNLKDDEGKKYIGYGIEARWHYLQAEAWDEAATLTFSLEAHLTPRGNPQLSLQLLTEIMETPLNQENRANTFHLIGILHQHFGRYDLALDHYKKSKEIIEKIGDDKWLAASLGQIGMIYHLKDNYGAALEHYERVKEIFDRIGDIKNVAIALHRIGMICQDKGDYNDALKHYEKAKEIFDQIGDTKGYAYALHQIGMIYEKRGDTDAALEQYRRSLEIKEKIGDIKGVATSLHQICNIHYLKGDYDAALEQYRRSLEIREKIGDIKGAAQSLHQIGVIYQYKGNYEAALEHYEKAKEIFERIGDIKGAAQSLHQIGVFYQYKGDYDAALEQYRRSLEIREKIGDIKGVAESLHQIGMIYEKRGDYEAALEHYEQARETFERIGDIKNTAAALHQIGVIYHYKGDTDAALEHYEKAKEIFERIGDIKDAAVALHQIGRIYHEKGEFAEALKLYVQSFMTLTKLQSPDARIVGSNIMKLREKMGEEAFLGVLEEMGVTMAESADKE
jgi:tetratricopeptide (TPR) repeat protein